ncbi:hypothetical protein [Pumilibacter intestinalis]|uniref:hypothetical protein n=1 Tax=Pumilibacter intestinalis TaxID=2941511 RepID=UPI00203F7999|nr:hypothetical protein [Pumilibacter intestinalis]
MLVIALSRARSANATSVASIEFTSSPISYERKVQPPHGFDAGDCRAATPLAMTWLPAGDCRGHCVPSQ